MDTCVPCSTPSPNCNPCCNEPTRTDCEPLPSALDNFVSSFFGVVEKVLNEDGTVTWVLPCDLDTGIPSNPREDGEGLACYFKRLFEDGLTGLTGPQGDQGEMGSSGDPGENAFSTTDLNFTEPAVGDTVAVSVVDVDWLSVGITVFIEGSGYYNVSNIVGNILNCQFAYQTGAGGLIGAGALVQAAGVRGAPGVDGVDGSDGADGYDGIDGADGATGNSPVFVFRRLATTPATPTGDDVPSGWSAFPPGGSPALWLSYAIQDVDGVTQGTWSAPVQLTGISSAVDDAYSSSGGSAQVLTTTPAALTVSSVQQAVVLPKGGTYLLLATFTADWVGATNAAVRTLAAKFRRTNNTAADVADSSIAPILPPVTSATHTAGQFTIMAIYTTANTDDEIDLFASISILPDSGDLVIDQSHFVAIRVSD